MKCGKSSPFVQGSRTRRASKSFDEGERLEAADDPEQHYREVILPEKVAQQLAYVRSATFWIQTFG